MKFLFINRSQRWKWVKCIWAVNSDQQGPCQMLLLKVTSMLKCFSSLLLWAARGEKSDESDDCRGEDGKWTGNEWVAGDAIIYGGWQRLAKGGNRSACIASSGSSHAKLKREREKERGQPSSTVNVCVCVHSILVGSTSFPLRVTMITSAGHSN